MTIDPTKSYTATMLTSCGQIVIQLDAVHAPIGVNSFVFLAKKGFYDGLTFHRIVKDFVIQGGDPKGDGTGGPGYQFAIETSPKVTFDSAGLLAYANSGPDTNGSQFFITLAPTPQLNPSASQSFTIFGKVTQGLNIVQKIGAIPGTPNPGIPGENSVPTQTVYIESVTIAVGPSSVTVVRRSLWTAVVVSALLATGRHSWAMLLPSPLTAGSRRPTSMRSSCSHRMPSKGRRTSRASRGRQNLAAFARDGVELAHLRDDGFEIGHLSLFFPAGHTNGGAPKPLTNDSVIVQGIAGLFHDADGAERSLERYRRRPPFAAVAECAPGGV